MKDVDDAEVRCVLLHTSAESMLRIQGGTLAGRQRLEMNNQLSAFVRGDKLSVIPAPTAQQKKSTKSSDLKGLLGYDGILWEMRFRHPTHYRMIGIIPQKNYFVGFRLAERTGIDWKTECNAALSLYYSIVDKDRCCAIKSDRLSDALSNWRIP